MVNKNHNIQFPNRLIALPVNINLLPSMTVWFTFHPYTIHKAQGKHIPNVINVTKKPRIDHPISCNKPPSKNDSALLPGTILVLDNPFLLLETIGGMLNKEDYGKIRRINPKMFWNYALADCFCQLYLTKCCIHVLYLMDIFRICSICGTLSITAAIYRSRLYKNHKYTLNLFGREGN